MSGPPRPFPTNYASATKTTPSQYITADEMKSRYILDLAFKNIPPKELWKEDFLPYQMLYRVAPQCFQTNAEPHQDKMGAPLHISVLLHMTNMPGIRFHLNGYMANGKFTMMECHVAIGSGPIHFLCEYDNIFDKNHPLYEKRKAERITARALRMTDNGSINSHE